jgi:putative transcriptional regulator
MARNSTRTRVFIGLALAGLVLALLPGSPLRRAGSAAITGEETDPRARAHQPRVPEPRAIGAPAAGRLLVATRELRGPFFAESVVVLLEYSPRGALGLVINHPSPALLQDLIPEVGRLSSRQDRAFIGGPVEPGVMTLLVRSQVPLSDALEVVPGVWATGSPDTLSELLKAPASQKDFRAFVGYSGWAPGQLDDEIARGDWHVAPGGAEAIFDDAPDDLWQRSVFEFEGIQVRRDPGVRPGLVAPAFAFVAVAVAVAVTAPAPAPAPALH